MIEIVLALGVISFALVGILGMFPLALDTAKDSKAETIIAFIGQSLLADISGTLETTSTGSPPIVSSEASILTETAAVDLDMLDTSSTLYFTFDQQGRNEQAVTESDYNSGVANSVYIVQLTAEHSPTGMDDLTRIQIDVEFPAAASPEFRQTHTFLRLIRP